MKETKEHVPPVLLSYFQLLLIYSVAPTIVMIRDEFETPEVSIAVTWDIISFLIVNQLVSQMPDELRLETFQVIAACLVLRALTALPVSEFAKHMGRISRGEE